MNRLAAASIVGCYPHGVDPGFVVARAILEIPDGQRYSNHRGGVRRSRRESSESFQRMPLALEARAGRAHVDNAIAKPEILPMQARGFYADD